MMHESSGVERRGVRWNLFPAYDLTFRYIASDKASSDIITIISATQRYAYRIPQVHSNMYV